MCELECCICYDLIGDKNNCVTECGHEFCFKCLALAMRKNTLCPMCRTPLIDEELDEQEQDDTGLVSEYDDDPDLDDDNYQYDYMTDNMATPDHLSIQLINKGVTYTDLVRMIFNRFEPFVDIDSIRELHDLTETILLRADNEHIENSFFAKEDTRYYILHTT